MKRKNNETDEVSIDLGYPAFQLAKALAHESDTETDNPKSTKWIQAIKGILSGNIEVGSRTPVKSTPAWATLEVITGGFTTGNLLAGGDLNDFECVLLEKLKIPKSENARLSLNQYYLSEQGISELQEFLENGQYEITVPEEAALLSIAALIKNDNVKDAKKVLEEVSPYFDKLRFYPRLSAEQVEIPTTGEVFVQSVEQVKENISADKKNKAIISQKKSIEIWIPFYEEMVDLFVDSMRSSVKSLADIDNRELTPFSQIDQSWLCRKDQLLDKFEKLKSKHSISKRWTKNGSQFSKLLGILENFSTEPEFYEKNHKYIAQAITRHLRKHGVTNSMERQNARECQLRQCRAPEHRYIRQVLAERLSKLEQIKGISNIEEVTQNTTASEICNGKIPEDTTIPSYLIKKLGKAKIDSIDNLIGAGVISSGDTIAEILPQISGDVLSGVFSEEYLKMLYKKVYVSFRKRRSLLLLNLESQVKIEELPWLKILNQYSDVRSDSRMAAKCVLKEVSEIALFNFPHAIIPNKLLQELRSLIKRADAEISLVDEVAADIFMGRFSPKFAKSAFIAGLELQGSLYEKYYALDYSVILEACAPVKGAFSDRQADKFSNICNKRESNSSSSGWSVAANGVVIEQQQIITTQNLAQLFSLFEWKNDSENEIEEAIKKCFVWICKRQQIKLNDYHAKLVMIKNTAYAWRQMIFFLSQLEREKQNEIGDFLYEHLYQQSALFSKTFEPIVTRLVDLVKGKSPRNDYIFTGWTVGAHYLLADSNP